jgi:hypothetical protein
VETTGDWSAVENRFGTDLPSDYKAFVETYGTGILCEFVEIFNPFSDNPAMDLLKAGQSLTDYYRSLSTTPYPCPYPVFPDPGGLLVFGMTINGDHLHWHTLGVPDEWIVGAYSEAEFFTFETCNLAAFLTAALRQQLGEKAFGREFFQTATFQPIMYRAEEHLDREFVVRPSRPGYTTYEFQDGTQVEVAADWDVRPGKAQSNTLLSASSTVPPPRDIRGELDTVYAAFTLRFSDSPTALTRDQLIEWLHESDDEELSEDERPAVFGQGEIESQVGSVEWLEYRENEDERRLIFFWIQRGRMYSLTCRAAENLFVRYRPAFEAVARSVRFGHS